MTKKIVLASGNQGKLQEMSELLEPLDFTVLMQSDFQIGDVEETGLTFVENAILKARHAASETGLPAIADDSGLEVDALNGAPGIYSARFSRMNGGESGDTANNQLLLEKLSEVETERRTARFRTVLVLMRHTEDPAPIIAEGIWHGSILSSPSGNHGFGYDPLFLSPETGTSAAMMDKQTKNSLSHRGKALADLIKQLKTLEQSGIAGTAP